MMDAITESPDPSSTGRDIEKAADRANLANTSVSSFGWLGLTVNVKDRATKKQKTILHNANGLVAAGVLSE